MTLKSQEGLLHACLQSWTLTLTLASYPTISSKSSSPRKHNAFDRTRKPICCLFFCLVYFPIDKRSKYKIGPTFSVHHIFSLLVPLKKEFSVMYLNNRGGGACRNVGGGGAHQRVFHRRNSCPLLPLPKFDHCLVSSVGRAPVCWARCLLAHANLFVIFTVSSVKIAICKQCISRHLSRRSLSMVLFR